MRLKVIGFLPLSFVPASFQFFDGHSNLEAVTRSCDPRYQMRIGQPRRKYSSHSNQPDLFLLPKRQKNKCIGNSFLYVEYLLFSFSQGQGRRPRWVVRASTIAIQVMAMTGQAHHQRTVIVKNLAADQRKFSHGLAPPAKKPFKAFR
jgi:hypothetical protein